MFRSFINRSVRNAPQDVADLEQLCSQYMVAMERAKDALRVDGWGSDALFEADAEMTVMAGRMKEILGTTDDQ